MGLEGEAYEYLARSLALSQCGGDIGGGNEVECLLSCIALDLLCGGLGGCKVGDGGTQYGYIGTCPYSGCSLHHLGGRLYVGQRDAGMYRA